MTNRGLPVSIAVVVLFLASIVRADTVPEPEAESILSPVLSPIHLRLMGVCEFSFIGSDSRLFHKFPASFRPPFPPVGQNQEIDNTLKFGFEEFTLVFDGAAGGAGGFHGAVLVTGSGSEPDTFSTPALLEAWGTYRLPIVQLSAGRVRNPFGGRFSDLPEYHLTAVDYRRFRGDGFRIDFDLGSGDLHIGPSLAVMERNPVDLLFFYTGRVGAAYQIKDFGTIGFGGSIQYGEDTLHINSWENAGYYNDQGQFQRVRFDGRYNVRRLDFGFDFTLLWKHARDSFFGDTELHAEFVKGSVNDDSFGPDSDHPNPQPPIGQRKPLGWWLEFSQWFNIGAGGNLFVAYGYQDRKVEPQPAWGIGEQGIIRELVVGYRQVVTRGFNVDAELWIVDDGQKPDGNGAPDFDANGEPDQILGNFVKVRFQFIF